MKIREAWGNLSTRRNFLTRLSLAVPAAGGLLASAKGALAEPKPEPNSVNQFKGRWRYRSFRNVPEPVTKLDDILFWEAILNIRAANTPETITGEIGDDQDKLTIKGFVTLGFPNFIRFEGSGLEGTSTAGWKYNYTGFLVPMWPDGIDQRDAIVGSVIRTVPHSNGKAKAGYVASFVGVRIDQPTTK